MNLPPLATLLVAITAELIATTSLKFSEGFSRLGPSIIVVIGYGTAFYFLSLTLKSMNIGSAYAIWSGLGTAGTAVIGLLLFREPITPLRLVGLALIIGGVLVLNLAGEGAAA